MVRPRGMDKDWFKRRATYKKCARNVAMNVFVLLPCMVYLGIGQLRISRKCPTWQQLVKELGWCVFWFEAAFYYTHRLMHVPKMYNVFHHFHHQLTHPIGFGALYAHPVEFVTGNFLPAAIGMLTMRGKVSMLGLLMWTVLTATYVVSAHAREDHAHVIHHKERNVNFGFTGVLDALHATRHCTSTNK